MSYSQNDEEEVILRLLGGRAISQRFLDIGAHDGVTFSNTRRLSDDGWTGTLVEPSPTVFATLKKNCIGRDLNLVQVAVVADGPERKVTFHDAGGDMVSTMDDAHRQLWAGRRGHNEVRSIAPATVEYKAIDVTALSVATLIDRYPGPYDFVNLDVEGTNFELFRELPLHDLGVVVICVEYQDKKAEITNCAAKQGYVVAHTTSENLILLASE